MWIRYKPLEMEWDSQGHCCPAIYSRTWSSRGRGQKWTRIKTQNWPKSCCRKSFLLRELLHVRRKQVGKKVTLMLVTDVGDQMCWWQVWDVGARFRMLMTDLIHNVFQFGKITNITKNVANIMILSPTSEISHHNKVTNITMSPTSWFVDPDLTPICFFGLSLSFLLLKLNFCLSNKNFYCYCEYDL